MENKFDFNDILIKPSDISEISTRKAINPFYHGFLPLITAPMDTVINKSNEKVFLDLKINSCLPRGEYTRDGFMSFSIDEFNKKYLMNNLNPYGRYLIDVANGHMEILCSLTKNIKKEFPNITLMVGNVANPETYVLLSEAGADYIRIGIGNGGGCFIENSLVITNKGEKSIQDIVIGDLVLTHTGEYKIVTSTLQYPSREQLIKINNTVSTKNHEFYVLNKKYETIVNDNNIHKYAEWIEGEKLTDEYFLLEMDVDV